MPNKIPSKKIKDKKIHPSEGKKTVARVALLTGCVQRVISPEINESTIRLLNRHDIEQMENDQLGNRGIDENGRPLTVTKLEQPNAAPFKAG